MPTHLFRNQKLKELTFKQVHALAVKSLSQYLELKSSGEKSSPEKVWDVLLCAAANNSSIDRECDELEGSPSPNTVRGVLKDSLELNQSETQVNKALGKHLKRAYCKKPQKVAVDLVEIPYHGQPSQDPQEVRRGQAKQGTTHFHVFATAYVVRRNRRVTLALHYVRQGESLVSVLDALKTRLDELDISVSLWLADRAFCSVAALSWFDQQAEAIVPIVARGKKDPLSGSRVLFAHKKSGWHRYAMNSSTDGSLTFDVAVVRRYTRPSRSRSKSIPPTTLVYAVVGKRMRSGKQKRSLPSVAQTYRSRFGIESSYRQMNQARLRTSSRSPELRLLAVAIAFLLRNLWVLCSWMTLSRPVSGCRGGQSDLRFPTLLRWISRQVEARLGLNTAIQLQAPSPLRF